MNKTPVIETHTNNLQNQSSHVKCYRRKKLSQQDQDTKESTNYTIAATYGNSPASIRHSPINILLYQDVNLLFSHINILLLYNTPFPQFQTPDFPMLQLMNCQACN